MERKQVEKMENIAEEIFDGLKENFLQQIEQGETPGRAFESLKNAFLGRFVERLIAVDFVPENLKPEEVKQIVEEVLQEKTKEIIETLSEKVDEAVDILGEDFSIVGKGQQKILDEVCFTNAALKKIYKDIKEGVRSIKSDLFDVTRSINDIRGDVSGLSSSVSSGFSRYFSDVDRKERGW